MTPKEFVIRLMKDVRARKKGTGMPVEPNTFHRDLLWAVITSWKAAESEEDKALWNEARLHLIRDHSVPKVEKLPWDL